VREEDTVARLGGDEFVVMLEHLSEQALEAAEQAQFLANKILTAISQVYFLDSHQYHCTSSIGINLFTGQQIEVDRFMQQADIAMYQAKNDGRNTLRFYDQKMQDTITFRASLERELRVAIDREQLQLYYQVQVDGFGHPYGAEVLIRWIHPERGLISPAQFIPLAEENNLILPIGKWVLEKACAQIKTWEQNALTSSLSLSVNVSAKQFRQVNFVEQVQAIVQGHGINTSKLKLELTESMLVDNVEDTITIMNKLNGMGVRFELDDFGTGYSSLQYLKNLPLYQLKIDQSFVHDIASNSNDHAIVCTIIAMAKSLELEVIAEGVETEDQRQHLFDEGCKYYQGYLFGKPMPIDEFEQLLMK
jgi:EAL domain-containing protein (putative c-di-GMP-specific phosphodiesterase class I)